MTVLIAKTTDLVPSLRLRATGESEEIGMDDAELGEFVQDFVELRRDFNSWSAPGVENGKKVTGESVHANDVNGNGDHRSTNGGELVDPEKRRHLVAAGDRHGIPDHSAQS